MDSIQRVEDFGTLSLKWDVFIRPLPLRLRELWGRGSEKIPRVRGDGRH